MSEPRIRARDVSVIRCRSLTRAAYYACRDTVGAIVRHAPRSRLRRGEFYALEAIDLSLDAGEAIAVIGDNGAGKSTLLKTLAGMLPATTGSVERNGSVAAVIELGVGLNPLLSGRENVSLAALLRELPADIACAYLHDVEAFADLGEAFDVATGSYSSGMTARLAFAMAAMTRPDVLLVDEALSVGDLAFQRKCTRFIEEFLGAGGALVLASHNVLQVQSLCQRAILIDSGRAIFTGAAVEAVRQMIARSMPMVETNTAEETTIRLIGFGGDAGRLRTGAPARIKVEYTLDEDFRDVIWGFGLWTADNQQCVTTAQDLSPRSLAAGRGTLECEIERLPIAPGNYTLRLYITDRASGTAVALSGWGRASTPVTVDSPASIESNHQLDMRQMVVLDVNWQ
ncbi:ABC transporter ATP-binding protein [Flavisphingopyxis soli]|nr:ABC transporter ATP-binding protein [Sphingorhabdus soli]